MCGIAGFADQSGRLKEPEFILQKMTDSLIYRGPDGQGLWFDKEVGVGLGHRRLSIIDLSSEGHQPMLSSSGRYVITYNGEVYNFDELRAELEKCEYTFRGHSDTEIILTAIEAWGLEQAVCRFIGMFAFALWDRKKHKLHLVRDRLGIKPLYYGYVNDVFMFASELKALRSYPEFSQSINRGALATMLRHGFISAPYSIYQGIQKLSPGHILSLDIQQPADSAYQVHAYWSAKTVIERAVENPFTGSFEGAVEQLDELLREAVRLRMLSDVPLGAFLSGGIDSSTIVALMQAQSTRPVKTYTIGFNESRFNEANYASAVAQHLGTEHTELYVTSDEALSIIPRLPTLYDEPFADSSQIPTFLVSELTRKYVTVSLSGDGGDELFHGYRRYFNAQRKWKQIGWMPPGVRDEFGRLIKSVIPRCWNRPHTLGALLLTKNADGLYEWLLSHWKEPTAIVHGGIESLTIFNNHAQQAQLTDFSHRMMFMDLVCYLPDDILVKVDRASMAVGLEARVPLLDHRVVEFAWSLPMDFNKRQGKGKRILRQVLNKYVPKELVERPKKGFGVPIGMWLRGPLRDWAENLLDEYRISHEGYFDPGIIREKWEEHLQGKRDWHSELWNVLMFQAWLENDS